MKRNVFILLVIVLLNFSFCIVYSELCSNLTVSGSAVLQSQNLLKISDIKYYSSSGTATNNSCSHGSNSTEMDLYLENSSSSVTYEVTITNNTGNAFTSGNITISGASNVTYTLSGISTYTIYNTTELKFRITLKLNNSSTKQNVKVVVNYGIEEVTDTVFDFYYFGGIEEFNVPYSGVYKLEVWGAEGGSTTFNTNSNTGGRGGYSKGNVTLTKGTNLYVVVGGKGRSVTSATVFSSDIGYNGGGYGGFYPKNSSHGGGGGATHIALDSGLLSTFKNKVNRLYIVAGGGGGADTHTGYPNYSGNGGYGGGTTGGPGVPSSNTCYGYGLGGTQSAPGGYTMCKTDGLNYDYGGVDIRPEDADFGKGANYTSFNNDSYYSFTGGGGGYWGGHAGYHNGGGGGSGYISSALSSTQITGGNNSFASPSGSNETGHTGNGHARITLLTN